MGSGVMSHFLALLTRPRKVGIFGDALVNLECFWSTMDRCEDLSSRLGLWQLGLRRQRY